MVGIRKTGPKSHRFSDLCLTLKSSKGFSLTELLISLIITFILILTIGVISNIALASFNRLSSKQQTYNDISYAFKRIQFKVRNASFIATGNKASPWVSNEHFLIDGDTFGLYQTSATVRDLIYDDGVTKEKILTVAQPGLINLALNNITSSSVTLTISGTKDKTDFNLQTTILRRNP